MNCIQNIIGFKKRLVLVLGLVLGNWSLAQISFADITAESGIDHHYLGINPKVENELYYFFFWSK